MRTGVREAWYRCTCVQRLECVAVRGDVCKHILGYRFRLMDVWIAFKLSGGGGSAKGRGMARVQTEGVVRYGLSGGDQPRVVPRQALGG